MRESVRQEIHFYSSILHIYKIGTGILQDSSVISWLEYDVVLKYRLRAC